jgi:hypothetical protein
LLRTAERRCHRAGHRSLPSGLPALLHADADAKFSCPFLQPFDDLGIEENENGRTNQNESDEQEQTNLKEYIEEDQLWDGFLRNQS